MTPPPDCPPHSEAGTSSPISDALAPPRGRGTIARPRPGRGRLFASSLPGGDNEHTLTEEARSALDCFQKLGAAREAYRAEAVLKELFEGRTASSPPGPAATDHPLTSRELEVLRLVAEGLGDKEIADRLHLSGHTVHRHISNIRTKLGLPSRSAAVAWAAQHGLL